MKYSYHKKIHREVGRAKDLSAPRIYYRVSSHLSLLNEKWVRFQSRSRRFQVEMTLLMTHCYRV